MRGQVINIIGPYNGPYENNLLTYKIKLSKGNIIVWHENGVRGFPLAYRGDFVEGLVLKKNKTIDYKNSRIRIISIQLKMLL